MKHLIVILSLGFCFSGSSQTAVISTKSHSGNTASVLQAPDNFGGRMDYSEIRLTDIQVDTVILYGDCLIEKGESLLYNVLSGDNRSVDTICNNESLRQRGYNLEIVKTNYPQNVVFIGFKNEEVEPEPNEPDANDGGGFWINGSPFENGTSGFLIIVFISLIVYTVTPILRKK